MTREHHDLQFRFAINEAGTFDGYAVVFAEQNKHREFYQPGAFRRTLDEHRAIGSRPVMLWSHDPREVIGVWTDVREDATGLFVRGQILLDTVKGREVASMVKAKAVNGLSIGFSKVRDRVANGVRTLLDVDLPEISVVAIPSAGRARIQNYRQAPGQPERTAAFVDACRKAAQAMRTSR